MANCELSNTCPVLLPGDPNLFAFLLSKFAKWWSTNPLTFCTRIADTSSASFRNQSSFKFAHGAKHRENHFSHWRRCVHLFAQRHKFNSQCPECFQGP